MELQLNKVSFIDEFRNVRSIENRKVKERSEGFKYLHDSTTKRLAEGVKFSIKDIDFSKFTYDDLEEYMQYYENVLAPKIKKVETLFSALRKAETVFSPSNQYY